jgi:pyrroline-5-carboxylate reductase
MTVGIIGMGTMGSAVATALRERRNEHVIGTTRGGDNAALVRESDVVVLCVKPYQARAVLESVAADLTGKLVISIAAAVTTDDLHAWSGGHAGVVRAMPNTPVLIGAGMTVLAAGKTTTAAQLETAVGLFDAMGRTAVLPESLLDGATGLSGCGPAYVFLIIEALAEAGVKLGIDPATSTLLAAQTLLGAARLVLERGEHPAVLRDEVTTPGGCTIDGLVALENGGLRSTLIAGVVAAANRSRVLRGEV